MLFAAENKRNGEDSYPEYPRYDELKRKAQLNVRNV